MKKITVKSIRVLFFLLVVLFLSCKKEKPVPPILATTEVTAISYTTATSGGNVTDDGGEEVTSKGVCWSTSDAPDISNNKSTEIGGLGSFSTNLTQLTPNTVYYVRAYANNIAGTGYGNQTTFKTSQVGAPVLTTTAVTSITKITAVSGGNVTADNGGAITGRGVCWSTNTEPAIEDSKSADGTGTGIYTSSITGLTMGTTYFVRAYATNNKGTSYGTQLSFTTLSPPTVTTSSVEVMSQTTAMAGGNVTAAGDAPVTFRGVCWSTSLNPTILDNKTTDNSGTGSFTSLISGLTTGTSYFVRAYATNAIGTAYGNNVTWVQKPSLVKLPASGFNTLTMGVLTTGQLGLMFEVKREIFTPEALNQTTTAVLQFDADTSILKGYNIAHNTTFIPLPSALGTTSPALSAGKMTITFAAGETSKAVSVFLPNSSFFDFTKKYALAFKLTEVTAGGAIDNSLINTIVVQIQALNKYDGRYEVTALSPMVDVLNTALSGWYPFTFELETSGEHSVKCLLIGLGYDNYNHPVASNGSPSIYGLFGLELFFDPSGNGTVIDVKNPWGNPPSNTRMPALDPTGVNKWDPATKKILLKYFMKQPSFVPDPPNIRTFFDETWTYKGPR